LVPTPDAETIVKKHLRQLGITVLPVQASHALRVMRLPFHHRDPFDRLLVAQCLEEGLPLLSSDKQLHKYEIEVIW
jgi:PIN domain nuclease of toxin-antitoxin system